MLAIAGPPASGKSIFAEKLSILINQITQTEICEVIPMDGFHLDNDTLDKLQLRHRKGAVDTFDAEGFSKMIKKLQKADKAVNIPLFDRHSDAVIPNAKVIVPKQKILIIEGNYLLVNSKPWSQLHQIYNYKIQLKPKLDTIKTRLVDRWLDNGYDLEDAKTRAISNDIPNAKFVLENSVVADLVI